MLRARNIGPALGGLRSSAPFRLRRPGARGPGLAVADGPGPSMAPLPTQPRASSAHAGSEAMPWFGRILAHGLAMPSRGAGWRRLGEGRLERASKPRRFGRGAAQNGAGSGGKPPEDVAPGAPPCRKDRVFCRAVRLCSC